MIECLTKHFMKGPLRILDVGIGDGRYIGKVVTELDRAGISATVCGVDPSPASARVVSKLFPAFEVTSQRFEDYYTREVFDVVIATHSLYYVDQAFNCLEKMVQLTKKGGITISVLWSEQCALYKIYKLYKDRCNFNGGNGFVTAESACAYLESLRNVDHVRQEHFHGRIVLSSWRNLPGMSDSACMIFSRDAGIQKNDKVHKEYVTSLRDVLNNFSDIEQRVNGVIFVFR